MTPYILIFLLYVLGKVWLSSRPPLDEKLCTLKVAGSTDKLITSLRKEIRRKNVHFLATWVSKQGKYRIYCLFGRDELYSKGR